jgi:tetratricopeptide (TPR) repeat protein
MNVSRKAMPPGSNFLRWPPNPLLSGGIIIVVAVLLAFLPVFSAGFVWDDDAYVTANPLLTDPDGLQRIWFSAHTQSQYFPLTFTTLRLEYRLWGLHPLGYHAVNVLLHCANALLAWALLRRLALPGAWLAAAIFALHPVQVESVAWVTELKNLQSTFFYLLALLAWLRFALEKNRAWRFYVLTLVLYVLALCSKTTACTLPAAMLLVLWLRKEPIGWPRLLQLVPFVVLGAALGAVSVWWEGHLGNYQHRLGLAFSPLERLLIATRAVPFYAGKLVWPLDLAFSYPRWQINTREVWQYAWGVGCILLAAWLWLRRRVLGRGPIAALIFFVAVLSPMLGFISLFTFYFSFVADHYQYLACLGPIALFAAACSWLTTKWRVGQPAQRAFLALLFILLGSLTWLQAGAYHDQQTLWRDTLKKNPRSWMAHSNLGMVLVETGNYAEAEIHYDEALRLKPDNPEAHYNLANLLVATRRIDDAISHYEAALRFNPSDADTHNNLGVVLSSKGQTAEAISHFREAVRNRPSFANAHYNLGVALASQNKIPEAIQHYLEALQLNPNSPQVEARLRALGVQRPGIN